MPHAGIDALIDALGIAGVPLPASELERRYFPRALPINPRRSRYAHGGGEVVWVGVERIGERDGRVALYLTENLPQLLPPRGPDTSTLPERARLLLAALGVAARRSSPLYTLPRVAALRETPSKLCGNWSGPGL